MFNKNQRSVVKTNEILYTKYSPKDHDSIFPLHIRKNCIITPIDRTLPDSSKRTDQAKKGTPCFAPSSFYNVNHNAKKVSSIHRALSKVIISSTNDKENNVLSLLNKLPDITLGLVKSETFVKVPKILPKRVEKKPRTIITPEVILNKNVLSKKQNLNVVSKKYAHCAKIQNIQRMKNKNTIKPRTFIPNNLKTSKLTKNNYMIPQKTNHLVNEDYTLMDLSINGKINIVHASFPLEYKNNGVTKYNGFEMEVNKSTEDSNNQNDTVVEISSSGQTISTYLSELSDYNIFLHFSDFINFQNQIF